jgi:hypothetical protein
MKVTKGPMLEKFAKAFDMKLDDVLEWINAYVNNPELFPKAEETEKARFESIKRYITWRLENTTEYRIRASFEERKAA